MAEDVAPVIERQTPAAGEARTEERARPEDRAQEAEKGAAGRASAEAADEHRKQAGKGLGTPEMDTSAAGVGKKLEELAAALKKGGGASTEQILSVKDLDNNSKSDKDNKGKNGEAKGTGPERKDEKEPGRRPDGTAGQPVGDSDAPGGRSGGRRAPDGRGHSGRPGGSPDAQQQELTKEKTGRPDPAQQGGTEVLPRGQGELGKKLDPAQQVGTDVLPGGQGELGKKLAPEASPGMKPEDQQKLKQELGGARPDELQEARGSFRWPGGVNWNNLLGGNKEKKSDVSPKDPGGAVSDFGQELQKQMQDRVGKRLEDGDFVPPSDSKTTQQRAGDLVNGIVNGELNGGFQFIDRMPKVGGAGMGDDKFYRDKIGEKTGDIDKKEQEIAKDMWDKLDPGTREKIKSEMESGRLMLLGGDQSSRTPNLDKFKDDVAKAIEGPEAERKQAEKDVYNALPDNAKRQLLEADEMNKWMGNLDKGISLEPRYETPFVKVDPEILDKYLSDKDNPDSWSRDDKNDIKEAGKLKAEKDAEGKLKKVTIGNMTFEKEGDTVTIKGAEKNAKGSTERYFDGVTDFKIVESKDPKNGSVTFDVRIKQTLPNKMTEGSIGTHKIQHENLKGVELQKIKKK